MSVSLPLTRYMYGQKQYHILKSSVCTSGRTRHTLVQAVGSVLYGVQESYALFTCVINGKH